MNADKEAAIVAKYKHLFEPEFVEWKNGVGFVDVGNGWTHIIEGMLMSIERRRLFVDKYLFTTDSKPDAFGFHEPMTIQISCIKEKLSSLRVYYEVNAEHKGWVDGLVTMATETASRTCESCGTCDQGVLGMTAGWITVVCKPCYDKRAETRGDEWKQRNPFMTKEEAKERFRFISL